MEQTFNDLCHERVQAERGLFSFALWMFFDIYYNKPFQIPTFETIAVSPEVLDKYVGVCSSPEAPVKFTITREGATLFVQPGSQSAAPLEATAQACNLRIARRAIENTREKQCTRIS